MLQLQAIDGLGKMRLKKVLKFAPMTLIHAGVPTGAGVYYGVKALKKKRAKMKAKKRAKALAKKKITPIAPLPEEQTIPEQVAPEQEAPEMVAPEEQAMPEQVAPAEQVMPEQEAPEETESETTEQEEETMEGFNDEIQIEGLGVPIKPIMNYSFFKKTFRTQPLSKFPCKKPTTRYLKDWQRYHACLKRHGLEGLNDKIQIEGAEIGIAPVVAQAGASVAPAVFKEAGRFVKKLFKKKKKKSEPTQPQSTPTQPAPEQPQESSVMKYLPYIGLGVAGVLLLGLVASRSTSVADDSIEDVGCGCS
jgi:hypothetical protein